MTYDKYVYFEIFEIENGWLLKKHYPISPKKFNHADYESFYHKDMKSLTEQLEQEAK